MKLLAPAKINLSLRITGKREDGYHELETLMCPLGLADELNLELIDESGVEFTCSDSDLPSGDDNLVVRAARRFQESMGVEGGVRIHLEKRVPSGAGLGGGSSDAASVLLGMDELCGTQAGTERLSDLAAEIGSDVPFFVYRSAAMCRGRGELVEPVRMRPLKLFLAKPSFAVPTPWAYGRFAESVELPGVDYGVQQIDRLQLVNDLERPVFQKFVLLPVMKKWLRFQPGVRAAMMSGSGSTMFAVLEEDADGETLAASAKAEFGDDLWTCCCSAGVGSGMVQVR